MIKSCSTCMFGEECPDNKPYRICHGYYGDTTEDEEVDAIIERGREEYRSEWYDFMSYLLTMD